MYSIIRFIMLLPDCEGIFFYSAICERFDKIRWLWVFSCS
jgi:hypothetical protein